MTGQLSLLRPWQLIPVGPPVDHGYTDRWGVWTTCPDIATDECQATVLSKDMRCNCYRSSFDTSDEGCQCVGDLMYRGGCLSCEWSAPLMRSSEHLAVCDALDHSWPSWRNLPVYAGKVPESAKPEVVTAWITKMVTLGYPEGWIERGGPIRERRQQGGTRPHTVWTGFGNYTVTGEVYGCGLSRGKTSCPGIEGCITGRCTPFKLDEEDD